MIPSNSASNAPNSSHLRSFTTPLAPGLPGRYLCLLPCAHLMNALDLRALQQRALDALQQEACPTCQRPINSYCEYSNMGAAQNSQPSQPPRAFATVLNPSSSSPNASFPWEVTNQAAINRVFANPRTTTRAGAGVNTQLLQQARVLLREMVDTSRATSGYTRQENPSAEDIGTLQSSSAGQDLSDGAVGTYMISSSADTVSRQETLVSSSQGAVSSSSCGGAGSMDGASHQ